MNWIQQTMRRIRQLFRRTEWESDLAEEMRLHVELRAAAQGRSPRDAEELARRKFGNTTLLREQSRGVWGWNFWDALSQDVRYSLRTLAANKGFAAAAVLSLTLGIGANTAIFSIVNAVMLRSLPVEDPERLVGMSFGNAPNRNSYMTNPIWEAVRDSQQAFSGTLAYSADRFNLSAGGESHFANAVWVSGNFFQVLGVPAFRGRVFSKDDDLHGGGRSGPVAVISYAFWQSNYAGDPDVLGKTVSLNRHNFQIIGITPPWFRGVIVDQGYDVAIPIGCEPLIHTDRSALNNRSWWWLRLMGRLRPGETIQQAEARMNAIAPEIRRATVPANWNAGLQAKYLARTFGLTRGGGGFSPAGRTYKTALFTLMTVVGMVLLIACANIANLLLARATARQREICVRLAIGASRARIIRQLLTESLLLALAGAAGGLLFSVWGARLLVRFLSTKEQHLDLALAPDVNVFGFTAAVALLTGLLFGLAPAFRATGVGPNQALKENSRGARRGATRFSLGKALVTFQVALSILLLTAAGLFLGTLRNFLQVDLGFNSHNVLLVNAAIPPDRIPRHLRAPLFSKILTDLRSLPGVRSAASSMFIPISHAMWNQEVRTEGHQSPAQPREEDLVYFNRISPGYFHTMEIPLLTGRDFDDRDTSKSPQGMVIGEATARHLWGSANPIGKTIDVPNSSNDYDSYQVIGVVKDIKYGDLDEPTRYTAFVSQTQDADPGPGLNYELRFYGSAESLLPAVRRIVGTANKDASITFEALDAHMRDALVQPRVVAMLSTFFGFLALLLAVIGLYGVISYAVARRRGEIGIRMALGAAQGAVTWLVLRDVILMLVVGTTLGISASLGTGRFVKSLLFGVEAGNLLTLAAAAAILCAASLIAAYLPARRAARMDPMIALREE
jgi:predicted permease